MKSNLRVSCETLGNYEIEYHFLAASVGLCQKVPEYEFAAMSSTLS
jgi:hypothetical protein